MPRPRPSDARGIVGPRRRRIDAEPVLPGIGARGADIRFVSPRPVRRAAVAATLPLLRDSFRCAGIATPDLVSADEASGPPDMMIGATGARPGPPAAALALAPWSRRSERAWATTGHCVERVLVLGSLLGPRLVLPLGRRRVVVARAELAVRHSAAAGVIATGLRRLSPCLPGTLIAATQASGRPTPLVPWLVDEALRRRSSPAMDWYLQFGTGDALQRAVFVLFAPEERQPTWVVKFSRAPGRDGPFEREEQAAHLLGQHAPRAARRAARQLDRWSSDGLPVSLEEAGRGRPLHMVLGDRRRSRRARLTLVDDVADWAVALGRESMVPAGAHDAFRRVEADLPPPSPASALEPWMHDGLRHVPGVLAHHDLGPWNILSDGRAFTVIDWESVAYPSLPLWDVLYFLTAALSVVDASPHQPTPATALGLLRGASPGSPMLFAWLARAARALDVPPSLVGPLATLCWLHHGRSGARRRADLAGAVGGADRDRPAGGEGTPAARSEPMLGRLAPGWARDPLLGPRWPAFMRATGAGGT